MRFLMSQIVFSQSVLNYVRQNVDVGLLFLYSIIRCTNYVCLVRMVLCENSMGIFIHMTCLDQSPASENNWWIINHNIWMMLEHDKKIMNWK